VNRRGYAGCVRLFNASAEVILEPNCGGRVLEYSLNGRNVLYADPAQDSWTEKSLKSPDLCGGRFDIGPEKIMKSHPVLWQGKWKAEITGARAARLTSAEDPVTGLRLVREFLLDEKTSHLRCTQTMTNVSADTVRACFWSRTLAEGGGIALVPLTPGSRFPRGYIVYEPASGPKYLNFRPDDHPSTRVRDGFLEILDAPPFPKHGIDTFAGWLGYLTRSSLLFVKRFPVYPERVYGEVTSYTVCIWYKDDVRTELEPIGPWEWLAPGKSSSFSEDWWLLPYEFPKDKNVNLMAFTRFVEEKAR
ncbi:MAG: alpha/beta hydrolase-fold protein, partial [Candidatus Latescibacterota bacterium]